MQVTTPQKNCIQSALWVGETWKKLPNIKKRKRKKKKEFEEKQKFGERPFNWFDKLSNRVRRWCTKHPRALVSKDPTGHLSCARVFLVPPIAPTELGALAIKDYIFIFGTKRELVKSSTPPCMTFTVILGHCPLHRKRVFPNCPFSCIVVVCKGQKCKGKIGIGCGIWVMIFGVDKICYASWVRGWGTWVELYHYF